MLDEIKGHLPQYEIKQITKHNFKEIFEVYEANQDFFVLTQGKEATIESSIGDIIAMPPNCDISQKIFVSMWEDGKVIAVLDLIERFPNEDFIWIGLLLVHSDYHGQKLGSGILEGVLAAAKARGYKAIQIGVIESNIKAISFWKRHGFEILRNSGDIVVMEREV